MFGGSCPSQGWGEDGNEDAEQWDPASHSQKRDLWELGIQSEGNVLCWQRVSICTRGGDTGDTGRTGGVGPSLLSWDCFGRGIILLSEL